MMNARSLTLLGVLALGASLAPGQPVPVPSGGAPCGPTGCGPYGMDPRTAVMQPTGPAALAAPLVAAKFHVPKGVRVVAYPGSPLSSKMYDTKEVFGLRPGYRYRFELNGLPYHPGVSLYPEIEVRGSLVPRPGMKYMDYPLPIALSQDDIEKIIKGAVITKIIYMENPAKALPTLIDRETIVEIQDANEELAVRAANDGGRLMAVVRIGNRRPTEPELRAFAIDGTILLPGEKHLKAPAAPPFIPFFACPFYDPILGPKPANEECFLDGGDRDDPLGIGPFDRLGGLNPTDVGVEYTVGGRRRVTTSNVVCICSPRYIARRTEILPTGGHQYVMIGAHTTALGLHLIRDRHAAMVTIELTKPAGLQGSIRPSSYVGKVGLSFYLGSTRPLVVGQISGIAVTAAVVEPEQLTAYPTLCPLTVTKNVDPPGPKEPGDIVTITIRYANTGNKAVSDLAVSDSLSGRLEYVPGSAQSDRPANFTAAENEVGSVVVKWDLPGTLLPGQSGTVKFKARVR